jgi:ssDNA-binding Zn-finger/Zn-ribbon topoisomerase 1
MSENAEEMQAPVVTDVPAPAAEVTTQPPPEAPAPTVSVSIPPPPPVKKEFKPRTRPQSPRNDRPTGRTPEEIAAFIARKNAEHMSILEDAGYSPVAVSTIINNFANKEAGYERGRARDHLMLMLETVSEALRYGIDSFTINESSVLDSLLNQTLADLISDAEMMKLPAVEGMKKAQNVFHNTWKRKERIMGDNTDTFYKLKKYFLLAINPTVPEGYAGRARYLLECIIFVRANQVEIFSGMLHAERIPAPGYVFKKLGINTDRMCPKCGKKMVYVKWKHRLCCTNSLCENWEDPGTRPSDGQESAPAERISKKHQGGYDSGKPIETMSGKERFNKRFSRPLSPEKKAAIEKRKQMKATMDQMHSENEKKIAEGNTSQWAALDKLKLVDQPATQETEAPSGSEQLPPPPAEIQIPADETTSAEDRVAEAPTAEAAPDNPDPGTSEQAPEPDAPQDQVN